MRMTVEGRKRQLDGGKEERRVEGREGEERQLEGG